MSDLSYKIARELRAGKLPPEFMEEHRIVDPAQPAAQATSDYMESIVSRLFIGQGIDPASVPLRYVLVNDDAPNAFMISGSNPAIMGVTKGLIAKMQYEDEVAGIARHELEHNNLRNYNNTKVQEWLADQSSINTLQNAGYNPEGLIIALKRLPKPEVKGYHNYLDVHPDIDLRIRDLENNKTIKERKEGALNSEWTPIDASVQATVQTAITPPRHIEKLLQDAKADTLPPTDKIRLLAQLVEQEFTQVDSYFQSRIEDFSEALSTMKIDQNDPAQKEALNDLVDKFLIHPASVQGYEDQGRWNARAKNFYSATEKAVTLEAEEEKIVPLQRPKFVPIGRLQDLDEAIESFISAPSAAEAEKHATTINAIASRYDFSDTSSILGDIKLRNFSESDDPFTSLSLSRIYNIEDEIASGKRSEGIEVPWSPHVGWANESESKQIRYVLQRLKLGDDPRLKPLNEIDKATIQILPVKNHDMINAELRFNEQGQVIGVGADFEKRLNPEADGLYKSQLLESEISRMERRDAFEKNLVNSTDWSQMQSDWDGFLVKHKKYLTPETTVAPAGGDTFAREFVKRLDDLVRKDPETYGSKLKALYEHGDKPGITEFISEQKRNSYPVSLSGHFAYGMPQGISLEHPFTKLILDDPHQLFTPKEKVQYLQHTTYLKNRDPLTPEQERFALPPEKVFGAYEDNFDGLLKFFNENPSYDSYTLEAKKTRLHRFLESNDNASLEPQQMHAIRSIAEHVSYQTTEATKQLVEQFALAQSAYDLRPGVSPFEIADTYALYVAGKQFADNTALRRSYEAAIKERAAGITDPAEKEKIAQALLYSRKIPTLLEEHFIKGQPYEVHQYTGQLHSHDFRDWAIGMYVEGVSKQLGLDDGSDAYHQRVVDKIGTINNRTQVLESILLGNVHNTVISEILPPLAEAINAQPKTAFLMRDIWSERNLKSASDLGHLGGGVELSIDVLSKDRMMRQATMDFITAPLTPQSALEYGQLLERAGSNASYEKSGLNKNVFTSDMSDSERIEKASQIHINFSRAPMEARGWYLEKILFPPGERDDQSFKNAMHLVMSKTFPGEQPTPEYEAIDAEVRNARREIVHLARYNRNSEESRKLREEIRHMGFERGSKEEILAQMSLRCMEMRDTLDRCTELASETLDKIRHPIAKQWDRFFGKGDEEGRTLRQIAESYIEVVPVPEQRLLLTAVMSARDVSQQEEQTTGTQVSAGKFAARVLGHMDEMGGKILQAIDSHNDVSAKIKKDMGDSKSDYNKPKRWEAVQWCMDHGIQAETPGEQIVHYGRVIASGSMGFTMFNKTADGNEYADTLLRPHAAGRTEREADNMIKASHVLAAKNPKFSVAEDIAEVAKRNARIETCMSIADKQGKIAKQVYEGLETTAVVNGRLYSLKHEVADVIKFSEGGKRAKVMQGVHFKDLPEATQEQRDFKKATAIQLYGTEMFNSLSGKPEDQDRHGKNQKVEEGVVRHFDWGMTALALPTEAQKREVAKAVIAAQRDHLFFRKDVAGALDNYIHKTPMPEDVKAHLCAFERKMSALGDVEAYLTDAEKKSVMGTIMASGRVDPVIKDQMQKSLGPLNNIVVKHLTDAAKKNPVFSFDDSKCVKQIVIPELTPAEQAIVRGEAKKRSSLNKSASTKLSSQPDAIDRELSELIRKMSATMSQEVAGNASAPTTSHGRVSTLVRR